jgi:hypothetical protein
MVALAKVSGKGAYYDNFKKIPNKTPNNEDSNPVEVKTKA